MIILKLVTNPFQCSGLKEYGYEELEEMLKIKDQFLQVRLKL